MCRFSILTAAIVLLYNFTNLSWAELVLVKDGRACTTIVAAKDAPEHVCDAALELQTYLEKISGARIPITDAMESVAGCRILVGRSQALNVLNLNIPSGHTHTMQEEAAVIRTIGNDLVLAGNDDWEYQGTRLAVYTFLDDLGCRWYFPGEYGEIVPRMKTIVVPDQDRIERPSFRIRHLWYSGWMPISETQQENYRLWYKRNRLNSLALSLPGDGSIDRLRPDEYFETHPEIFALNDKGERFKELLNLTEPEAVRIGAETIKEYFRNNPDGLTFGFAPHDGFPMDYSEATQNAMPGFEGKGYGDPSMSDVWFNFANNIAKEVYKEFPDRWVLTNGYANRVRFPEGVGELSPNLGIQSAVIAADTMHRIGDPKSWQRILYKDIMDRWSEELDLIVIYDYDPGNSLDNLPFPALHNLKYDLPYFHERGIWGFYTEGSNTWMVTHLNYYVRARLMWDVDSDVEELVDEYCELFYGDAAQAVEDYIWTLEKAVEDTKVICNWGRLNFWKIILTPPVRSKLDRLMAKAEKRSVDAGPDIRKRIFMLRLVHDHMNAYLDMQLALERGEYQKAVDFADLMLSIRDRAEAIEPGLLPNSPDWVRTFRTSLEWHKSLYQELADKAGGKEGELVQMLPQEWFFKKDTEDVGVIKQWYSGKTGHDWAPIDTTLPWEYQGYADEKGWAYWGKAWYRTDFDLSAEEAASPLWLTIGAVYNRGVWIWVNGELQQWEMDKHWRLGHHDVRKPIHIDVSKIVHPGKNELAVLVNTPMPERNPRSGIHRRSFLWRPKGTVEK